MLVPWLPATASLVPSAEDVMLAQFPYCVGMRSVHVTPESVEVHMLVPWLPATASLVPSAEEATPCQEAYSVMGMCSIQ